MKNPRFPQIKLIFAVIVLFTLAFLSVQSVLADHSNPSQLTTEIPTRTPKACHICETVGPDFVPTSTSTSTSTATLEFCEVDDCTTVLEEKSTPTPLVDFEKKDDPLDEVNPVDVQNKVIIYLFWGEGCPHCEEAKPFLKELDESSDQVDLQLYEVWYDVDNQDIFTEMAAKFGFEPRFVPTIFLGGQYWVGYTDQIKNEIQSALNTCLETGCPDAGAGIVSEYLGQDGAGNVVEPEEGVLPERSSKEIQLPLIGTIDLSTQSLFTSTLLISFVDGFNPCSVWVLTMLLALTLHTGSRKKVFWIGFIFLTVSTTIYGLFIAGLFTMFTVVSFVGWIQVAVALVALFFALVNIKDYFFYQEGISFTISAKDKPGLFQKIRKLMDSSQSMWGLIGGTVVLSAGVSLVEFSCTAGFPVLWSNLLVAQNVSLAIFLSLLLVYLLIYQIDEMGIFLAAILTMRASKLEEKHGRILKLISGVLMLSLAVVMLVDPNLMSDLTNSLLVFGIAFGTAILILIVHRFILPQFGIRFGLEADKTKSSKKKYRRSK